MSRYTSISERIPIRNYPHPNNRPFIRSEGTEWSQRAKAAHARGVNIANRCRRCGVNAFPEYAFTPLCDPCLDWEIQYLRIQNETGGHDGA